MRCASGSRCTNNPHWKNWRRPAWAPLCIPGRMESGGWMYKKARSGQTESHSISWQGQKDSNPQQRFWRPTCYHYTMPLRIQQKRLYQNRRQKSIYKLHQKEKMLLADPAWMACGSMPPILKKSDLTRERGAASARLCARRLGRNLAMGALGETPGADSEPWGIGLKFKAPSFTIEETLPAYPTSGLLPDGRQLSS